MLKKKLFFILGIILIVNVLSLSDISAIESDFFEWDYQESINDFFNMFTKEQFSVLGRNANCDVSSAITSTFTGSKLVSCANSNTNYPSSNNCLVEVFYANYQGTTPGFECGSPGQPFNGCVEYIVTTGSVTINALGPNSIYEVYNCPQGSLEGGATISGDCDCDYGATDTDCDSEDTCSVSEPVCLQKSGDDDCVSSAEFGTECPNGLDGSSKECDCDTGYFDSNWDNARCSISRPYCIKVLGYDYCATNPSGEDCNPNDYKQCYSGDVYWYDSCGNRGVKSAECGSFDCINGKCIDTSIQGEDISLNFIESLMSGTHLKAVTLTVSWFGGESPYTLVVSDWGDGNSNQVISTINSASLTWIYDSGGTYTIDYCINDDNPNLQNYCSNETINVKDCNTGADTNCDGIVDRNELGIVINNWRNGLISRNVLGSVIEAWAV